MALPATLADRWPTKTLRRLGGIVVPGTGGSTPVLTGDLATAGFQLEQIADENNVTRWILNLAGTRGAAAPVAVSGLANNATLTGTISDATDTCAVTLTAEANAYAVRPRWTDGTSGTQSTELRETLVNTNTRVQLADRIRPRPGVYGLVAGAPTTGQAHRYLTPQGTWNGDNHVIIEPYNAFEAVWHRFRLDGTSATTSLAYLCFKGIHWTSAYVTPLGADVKMFTATNANKHVKFDGCRFWGPGESLGVEPTGRGRDMASAIGAIGDDWIIEGNDFQDVLDIVTQGQYARFAVRNNTARRFWNDGIKVSSTENDIFGNFFTDKAHADPANLDGDAGAHTDWFQHLGRQVAGTYVFGRVSNNIFVRGVGRDLWPDAQGIFPSDSNNGAIWTDATIENNIIVSVVANGINPRNFVNSLVRNNLLVKDTTVPQTVNPNTGSGLGPSGTPRIGYSSGKTGAGGSGGTHTGNVTSEATTFGSTTASSEPHSPPPTQTNNRVLDPDAVSGDSSYVANFAAPAFGAALSTIEGVKAAFKPKVGGPMALANQGPLDTDGNFRVYAGATAVTLSGPSGGVEGVASTNFTVGANGTITGDVIVTPSDAGAGGVFTPSNRTINSSGPTATFTYTPPAGVATRLISVTNNGGLTNPSAVEYAVVASPITTVTLDVPPSLTVGVPDTITASVDGVASQVVTITLGAVAGLTFGGAIVIGVGESSSGTSILATTAGLKAITGTDDRGLTGPLPVETTAIALPTPAGVANRGQLRRLGIRV